MERDLIRALMAKWVICLPLVFGGHVYALPPLSDNPLFLGGNISPNVMFTLDDSGSMHWEIMPDDAIYSYFLFPRASSVYNSGSDYSSFVPTFTDGSSYSARTRSPQTNPIYYNPAVTYQPWSNSDGSLMPNAAPTAAFHNPAKTSAGSRDLTANNTQSAGWDSCNNLPPTGCGYSSQSRTFYPAVYFFFNGGDEWNWNNYTKQEIRSNIPTYTGHGRSNRTDCTAGICTYDQEIQNFANWYTYYRSRILLARAGIGRAFSEQGNTMRVGFAAINQGQTTVDGKKTDVVIDGVRQFTGADRTNFFNNLYQHPIPTSGTPLRKAVNEVGEYFERTDDKGPWGETPGSNGGAQHECRQNYHILMTDGFWNGTKPTPAVGNADKSASGNITNHSSPAIPPTYNFKPDLPYSDNNTNTLADYAMHYWKRDLRKDMLNKVPTNTADPAFWQHLVTFTVGLGVSGTLTELPSGAGAWPDPDGSDAAKIDDLWHAAVNGRGDFFSAADPAAFADALSSSLSNIVARTGSASAVAANSNSLMTNGRIYQAKFNSGDWSGQLLSIPIDSVGNLGATEWNAADVSLASGTINPSTRIVLTKGTIDGVAFEYANLTATQKVLLDKNAAGSVDNCGLERVAFLRGDAAKEGAGGTFSCASGAVANKFRSRTTSKLGDIVNSGPFYVGRPSAGHSDVDHPGYAAFSADYKDRLPLVYVGANDGILHGFNACIPGVTAGCAAGDAGKEMITYIPSMVYGNLSRLTDKGYNASHRYFVDGSPMVSDAYTGASPSWKSVLVGSLNGGGQGYYALNVTNPSDGAQSEPNFTAANAAGLLLWEFTDNDDIDMGYSHNLPPVDPFTGQAQQIVKMENGQWAVIVGNGYNSIGGKAVLYILFITGGEDGSWTAGVDYIKLTADSGILGVGGNGLSTPMPFDADGNGLVDVIYAGDLKGNLWKFDVSSSTPAFWKVALDPTPLGLGGLLFGDTPLFAASNQKPIISPPVISFHPQGGLLVMFGTGKYLETGDTTNTDPQTIYAVWDNNAAATVSVGDLVEQVITDGAVRTATQNLVTYSATVKGWYMDLPISGERLTGIPALEDGLFTFTTIIPSTSPCDFGGRGFVNTVDFLTGGMLPFAAFDINRNGIVAFNDGLSAGVEIGFSVGGVTRIRGHTNDVLISSRADGTLVKTPAAKGPAGLRGRITWRELIQ